MENATRWMWKRRWRALVGLLALLLAGCQSPGDGPGGEAQGTPAAGGDRTFLTVDFAPGRTLRYRFVSDRNVLLDWDPNAAVTTSRIQELTERLEMSVAYTPVEVDPYGVSTIEAAVESVEVTRGGNVGRRSSATDAVETAQGRSFLLKVDPRGRMVDTGGVDAFIRQLGDRAFRANTSRGRIKEPDMIADFIASQRFLWDPVASIEQPAEGVAVGQTWTSQLSVPLPMVMRKARDVTYRFDEVRHEDEGPVAVIRSRYSLADSVPSDWPVPYSGRFQVSGTFGFLGGYRVLKLGGGGETVFDIDRGHVEQRRQKYKMRMKASLPPMGIQADPHLTIDQTLTMELLGNPEIDDSGQI